jgi:outer membrane lipoprotein LolB
MGENFDIRLWGTFNIGNTLLAGNSTGVTITQDGQTKAAETPEKLLLEFLGYEVPVSYMHYWIRGIPSPTSQAQILYSENEQLAQITQNEWVIDYVDFRQYGDLILPRRIEANHERRKIKLRLIGLRWEIDKDA